MMKTKPLLPFVSLGCTGFFICFDENFKLYVKKKERNDNRSSLNAFLNPVKKVSSLLSGKILGKVTRIKHII